MVFTNGPCDSCFRRRRPQTPRGSEIWKMRTWVWSCCSPLKFPKTPKVDARPVSPRRRGRANLASDRFPLPPEHPAHRMSKSSLLAPIAAGVATAFVGFASSFAVVLKGLTAVGASDAQAASGLMALSIAMGIAGIILSLWFRMPISSAWSTPGAALLAATGAVKGGFPAAVGAFVIVGFLIVAAGLIRPFGRLVAAIPSALANAMLAGILFSLCLAPVKAMAEAPRLAAPIILVWLLMARWRRLFATPAAAIVAGV